MKFDFIPLDYNSVDIEGKTYVRIFGKTKKGKTICVIDEAVSFFYIVSNKAKKIASKVKKIEGVREVLIIDKKYMEKPVKVLRVYCKQNKIKEIADQIKHIDKNAITRERDISLITRYILEKKVKPLLWHDIDGEVLGDRDIAFGGLARGLDVDFVVKLDKCKESKKQTNFKPYVMAFDIEAEEFEIGKGEVLMISIVTDKIKKVITWKKIKKKLDFVEYVKDETELIRRFKECVKSINPDIITGYFSDGFDLPYLRTRAEKNKINLNLGKDGSRILFSRGRPLNARIKGLVHVDLFKFIETIYSQYLQSETLRLNDVAKELIGEGKLDIDHNKKSSDIKEEEWERYFEYNLQDSVLTYKLFQKFWPDMLEFARIIQEPLFNLNRYSMSSLVENYIIHNLERFNEIAERRPLYDEIEERRRRGKYEGAFVLQPEPNLYENLAFFDFTSMYASIIVSFNLSRSTLLEKKEKGSLEVDLGNKKVYFSKKQGIIPNLLAEIIELRKKYKKELKEKPDPIKKARSNAFKLLANAAYGYNGFFGARWYCPEAAASTTALARKFIKDSIKKTNKEDYKVIYADTDGFAFLLQKHTKKQVLDFLKKLNKTLPGIMELEIEDFYKRGIFVAKRTTTTGAKKKYALLNQDNKLKIRGFETVRRDWCGLARQIQNKVIGMILENGNQEKALRYVKKIIKQIKERKIDKKEFIIRTQLKKPISEYKAISPHVVAAQKMRELGLPIQPGLLIEYFVAETREKKKLVREKIKLPDEKGEYNIKYYLDHQILPAIENIFEIFDVNLKEIADGKKQMKLGEF